MAESENILLQRFARTGDAEAFSEIVRCYAGLVYGACLRVLQDQNKAADVVQETFFQLLRSAGEITGSLPAWLHRVATNKAIDVIRRDSSRRRREAEYAVNNPMETEKWEDISSHVDQALSELDDQTKKILIRHFLQGRTMQQVAAELDTSQPTVSRRVNSGIDQLRNKLKKRGIIVTATVLAGLLGQNAVKAAPAFVLKELGKMAILSATTAATGSGAAATATTAAKTTGAVLAGLKAKAITATVVAAVGVGSVVTYNQLTKQPEQPALQQQTTLQTEQPGKDTRAGADPAKTTYYDQPDLIIADQPIETVPEPPDVPDEIYDTADEPQPATNSQTTGRTTRRRRRTGGMMGGYGGGRVAGKTERKDSPDSNSNPPMPPPRP